MEPSSGVISESRKRRGSRRGSLELPPLPPPPHDFARPPALQPEARRRASIEHLRKRRTGLPRDDARVRRAAQSILSIGAFHSSLTRLVGPLAAEAIAMVASAEGLSDEAHAAAFDSLLERSGEADLSILAVRLRQALRETVGDAAGGGSPPGSGKEAVLRALQPGAPSPVMSTRDLALEAADASGEKLEHGVRRLSLDEDMRSHAAELAELAAAWERKADRAAVGSTSPGSGTSCSGSPTPTSCPSPTHSFRRNAQSAPPAKPKPNAASLLDALYRALVHLDATYGGGEGGLDHTETEVLQALAAALGGSDAQRIRAAAMGAAGASCARASRLPGGGEDEGRGRDCRGGHAVAAAVL